MNSLLSKNIEQLNKVVWTDAEFNICEIHYDFIKIKITESNGVSKNIICRGYIGFEGIGIWDEVVINKAIICNNHSLIDRSLNLIKKRFNQKIPDSGSDARNLQEWSMLQISFIDGSDLKIVIASIFVELL